MPHRCSYHASGRHAKRGHPDRSPGHEKRARRAIALVQTTSRRHRRPQRCITSRATHASTSRTRRAISFVSVALALQAAIVVGMVPATWCAAASSRATLIADNHHQRHGVPSLCRRCLVVSRPWRPAGGRRSLQACDQGTMIRTRHLHPFRHV